MLEDTNGDSWKEWRKHILLEIKRLNSNLEKLEEKNAAHVLATSVEIGRLKVWSAIYGGIAGMSSALLLREVLSRW